MVIRTRGDKGRRGGIAIVVGISIVVLSMSMALAVDVGFARVQGAQLLAATDAAALAGATALPYASEVNARALAVAGENLVGNQGVTLTAADIEIGTWDPDTEVFTVDPNGDAVRVSTTWSVPTLFARVAGFEQLLVPRQSIAFAEPTDIWCGIGAEGGTVFTGSGYIDGYCAADGAYGPSNQSGGSAACSNSHAEVGGSGNLDGSLLGDSVDVTGSGVVTGITGPLIEPYPLPPTPDWVAEVQTGVNDNNTIPPGTHSVNAPATLPVQGDSTCVALTLQAGNYWVDDININGNCGIRIASGPVNIFVDGDVSAAGRGVMNEGGLPEDLTIYASGNVDMRGTADFHGVIMTAGNLTLSGNSDFYGAYIADGTVSITGSGALHIDECLDILPKALVRSDQPRLVR